MSWIDPGSGFEEWASKDLGRLFKYAGLSLSLSLYIYTPYIYIYIDMCIYI